MKNAHRWMTGYVCGAWILSFGLSAAAQTVTILADLNYETGGPVAPYYSSLVQGRDGNLWGTSTFGGSQSGGTVFNVSLTGTVTTAYSFFDGFPLNGVVLGTDGNFYGSTSDGGADRLGSVFKITPAGDLTTLASLEGFPMGTVTQGVDGGFYGSTWIGGSFDWGYVFKVSPNGTLITLYSFNQTTTGAHPYDQLLQGPDGEFYGTTCGSSPTCGSARPGYGTIFKITSSGTFTLLHTFGGFDGAAPYAGLVLGPAGEFYGTTMKGGSFDEGTVFKVDRSGGLTDLVSFDGTNGAAPSARLWLATDGNFYGVTGHGGAGGVGTIFQMTPEGTLTTLYNFSGPADGAFPFGGLVQAADGNLYGMTDGGGTYNDGAVYKLDMGLAPFVGLSPAYGVAGHSVGILGYGLTGTTSVTFNGAAANFAVQSDTFLTAVVPTGATTGRVQVVTPSGTLTSNANFQVEP